MPLGRNSENLQASRLLEKSRQHLMTVAEEHGIALRQNYNRIAPRLAAQVGRYVHAKQFKRMRKPAQGRVGRCAASGDVWRRAQPAADPGEAAASCRPIRAHIAGSTGDALRASGPHSTRARLITGLFRAD